MEQLLRDPAILGDHVRAQASVNKFTGVGCSEAPRGILFHHYTVDKDGVIQNANLIIATAQNNLAMNRTVHQLASHFVDGGKGTIAEGILNRVEAGIRCYDPCLSCSTHALGQMPLHIELLNAAGEVLDEVKR
jgi:NAD-reducing hydrogenase large subunit